MFTSWSSQGKITDHVMLKWICFCQDGTTKTKKKKKVSSISKPKQLTRNYKQCESSENNKERRAVSVSNIPADEIKLAHFQQTLHMTWLTTPPKRHRDILAALSTRSMHPWQSTMQISWVCNIPHHAKFPHQSKLIITDTESIIPTNKTSVFSRGHTYTLLRKGYFTAITKHSCSNYKLPNRERAAHVWQKHAKICVVSQKAWVKYTLDRSRKNQDAACGIGQ